MSGGDWKEMYVAAERGDLDLVRYHISNGIDPNYQPFFSVFGSWASVDQYPGGSI